jgi:hypothetical protein
MTVSKEVLFNESTRDRIGRRWYRTRGEYTFFYRKGNENHGLGIFFAHKRIIIADKRIERRIFGPKRDGVTG